jgi:CRISPR/Cas system-associated exonuclease Cas4 (RecB family)
MIQFRESDHSYTADGKKYISMTTIIKPFHFPTNWKEVAEKYAKKHGHTAEYWQAQWGSMGAEACKIGSDHHKRKETDILGYAPSDDDVKVPLRVDYENLEDGNYPELLLWNHEYQLAGQADLVILETKGLKTYVDIIDYKTNKEIKTESYKDWKAGHQMMQGPLKHLQCCNYNHYNLQLSGYAWMMEQHGFIPRNIIIEHYPLRAADGSVDYNQTPVIYKMNYLKKEIVNMLNTYKQTQK